jgi:hypothetical protein
MSEVFKDATGMAPGNFRKELGRAASKPFRITTPRRVRD